MSTWSVQRLSEVVQKASVSQIAIAVITILLVRWILRGIHRVYFHPLSRFPGPKLSAFTRLPNLKASFTGSSHRYIKSLHDQYGEIVRVAPDELSFIRPDAWRDIYGHGTKGTRGSAPPKHWGRYGMAVNNVPGLIATQSEAQHTQTRRIFSPAFSDRSLKQQEPLFMKYVDQLVDLLKRYIKEDATRPIDMVRMYNFTTFDVMGDLTYGEPLHMLDKAEYDPWVSIIFGSVKAGSRLNILLHYPLLRAAFKKLAPASLSEKKNKHWQYSVDRVTKRLAGRASAGVDLWDLVLSPKDGKGLSRDEMDSNSSLFMIAGTETTATLVSGLTYLLLKNAAPMQKLVREIRAAFASAGDMSMEDIAALPYLNACLKEALRLYPPVATGLPHRTQGDGSTICGEWVPPGTTVSVPHYAMYTSARLFKDPLSFVPERWLGDERFADDQRAAVQPFSVGTRDCLGKNMAYHEMRLIMAKVLFNFDLELAEESEGWIEQDTHVLWQKNPLMVRLRDVGAS